MINFCSDFISYKGIQLEVVSFVFSGETFTSYRTEIYSQIVNLLKSRQQGMDYYEASQITASPALGLARSHNIK